MLVVMKHHETMEEKSQVLPSSMFQTDHGWILWYVGAYFDLPAFDATEKTRLKRLRTRRLAEGTSDVSYVDILTGA